METGIREGNTGSGRFGGEPGGGGPEDGGVGVLRATFGVAFLFLLSSVASKVSLLECDCFLFFLFLLRLAPCFLLLLPPSRRS